LDTNQRAELFKNTTFRDTGPYLWINKRRFGVKLVTKFPDALPVISITYPDKPGKGPKQVIKSSNLAVEGILTLRTILK
jgi:hypothetical protein